jgi:hypothetical protein
MPASRILALMAVVLFALAALDTHPRLLSDLQLVPAGLAFGFGAVLLAIRKPVAPEGWI